jgi:hypothetical protein
MDAEIEGTLGLDVLYTPPRGEATVEYDFRLDEIYLCILISDTAL